MGGAGGEGGVAAHWWRAASGCVPGRGTNAEADVQLKYRKYSADTGAANIADIDHPEVSL
eukprot:jgi/Ulvmu1/11820/UM080_0031.1